MRTRIIFLTVLWALAAAPPARSAGNQMADLKSGREVFLNGCHACHAPDGRGMPEFSIGFEPPPTFPDFRDCNATSRETDLDWKAIITHGGPARGFSEIMPSFAEALSSAQIDAVIGHLRTFCRNSSFPRGELNMPRPLITEKAFVEDETVLTSAVNAKGSPGNSHTVTYERRFGARNQIEVSFPFGFQHQDTGTWFGGIGDVSLGYKRLIWGNLSKGSVLSVQGEGILPTGNRARNFGNGVTIFETFASYGQLLPNRSFLQFQGGIEIPTDTAKVHRAVFWRIVFGKSMYRGEGFGRMWSPMTELLADRELAADEKTNWDIVPQVQITLNRRQHLRANLGVRFPVTDFGSRPVRLMVYFLWDRFDGGIRDGW